MVRHPHRPELGGTNMADDTQQLGIDHCCISQVINADSTMRRFIQMAPTRKSCCAVRIFSIIATYARLSEPALCKHFANQKGLSHYYLPIVDDGAAVVQLVADAGKPSDVKTMEAKGFKAEQYINESLAVIELKRLRSPLGDVALIAPLIG